MAGAFTTYRSYNDKAVAAAVYEELTKAGLSPSWEDTKGLFETDFAFNDFINIYNIRLRPEDFKIADEILEKSVIEKDEKPSDDYYLYSFTDEELIDVLKKPEEWNAFDQVWAKRILASRNVTVNPEELSQHKKENLAELRKPWELNRLWIFGGIALLAYGFYFAHILYTGGAFFLGLYIAFSKKTLPNGERVMAFSKKDRRLGKIIILLSAGITLFILLIAFGVFPISWYFSFWR